MKCTLASVVVALGIGAAPAAAQTLGLAEALGRADRSAYPNRMAAGEARARGGQATAALAAFLPTVRVENLWSRTNDPLGAFGFTLRQRAVSAASFAPDRLNSPDPISDFGSDLVLEQPLFNPDGLFGRRAAVRARAAGDASRDWTRMTTRTEVVRAYFGAVLAAAQVAALDSARRAAEAHVRQAESLVRNGMATRSDALLAWVRAGEISARLLSARAETSVAARRLAVAMGTPGDTALLLPPELPPADRIRGVLAGAAGETPPGEPRADVRSARLALEAANADVKRAGAAMLPRLNSFGRLHWSSGSTPYGGQNAWTVGVALSWTPFSGGAELGAR